MAKKPKSATEMSALYKLNQRLGEDFLADYEVNGKATIEKLRERAPEKYVEHAVRLTAELDVDDRHVRVLPARDLDGSRPRAGGIAPDAGDPVDGFEEMHRDRDVVFDQKDALFNSTDRPAAYEPTGDDFAFHWIRPLLPP